MLLLAALLAGAGGCGYQHAETFPPGYESIAVPIFENRSFYKGVEFDLAEALSKQVTDRTPYRLAEPGAADTMLEGTIREVKQLRVTRTSEGSLPEQMEVLVVVDFAWKDLRSGEDIIDRQGFSAVGRYIPTTPIGEPFAAAQHDAANRLAQDIVDQMRGDW
jgi:hypothetical protein